ncbi:MAG: peptidase [Clostridiales bacterium]|nr:peptidase [Clostridiales bacterium]
MTQFHRLTRWGLALLAALALALGTAATAFAAADTSPDLSRTGSVTVTLTDGAGNPVSGGTLTLYQAATLSLVDGSAVYTYTEDFQGCDAEPDVTDTALAAELARYAAASGLSGTAADVEADGTVTFDGLALGLYLIVQTTPSDNDLTINPFLVTVPMESDGVWDYAVDASPKVGPVTPDEPDNPDEPEEPDEPDEPDNPEEPDNPDEPEEPVDSDTPDDSDETEESTLPQTGQLNWPVPVLAVCGLVLFAVGWRLRASGGKETDE